MEEMNSHLSKSIEMKEIREAVFQIGGSNALGLDIFHGVFFHSYWEIIAKDIKGFVQEFASGMVSYQNLNSTHIVLIPNIPSLESMGSFVLSAYATSQSKSF